jgi:hypothetical protein
MKDSLLKNAFEELSTDGYLLLKVPESVEKTVRTTFEAAYPFFRSTIDEKMASRLPADTGYRQFAGEYSQSPDRPDQVESFTTSVRMSTSAANLESRNAQALYQRMLEVIEKFEPIAELVAGILATRINHLISEIEFCGAFRLWSFLQLNYSRPREVSEEFINDLHEDGCLLTITCTTAPGLELRTPARYYGLCLAASYSLCIIVSDQRLDIKNACHCFFSEISIPHSANHG